jgi:predicted nuclease of predicted toxin-antitoxin system
LKFLLDQDVYAVTARFLAALGHDVIRAVEVGLSRASDEDILREAQSRERLLVTRDRDFGNLVYVRGLGRGVLYLRILPSTQNSVHHELARILVSYSQEELSKAFVVVEPGRHRFRRLVILR